MSLITQQHQANINNHSENRTHLSIALALNPDAASQFCTNFLNASKYTETELRNISQDREFIYISKPTKQFLEEADGKCNTYSNDPQGIAELKKDLVSTHLLHENISKVTGLIRPFLEKLCNSVSSLRSIADEMIKSSIIQDDTTLESLNKKLESTESLENLRAFKSHILLNAPSNNELIDLLSRLIYNKENNYSLSLSLQDVSLLETLCPKDFQRSISKETNESFFKYIELKRTLFYVNYLYTQSTLKAGYFLRYKQTKGWDRFVQLARKIQQASFLSPTEKITKLEEQIRLHQNNNLESFKQLVLSINASPNGDLIERVDAVKRNALNILQKISSGIVLNNDELASLIKLQMTNYTLQNASTVALNNFSIYQKSIRKLDELKNYPTTENCSLEQKVNRVVYCKFGWNIFTRTLAKITTVCCTLYQVIKEKLPFGCK